MGLFCSFPPKFIKVEVKVIYLRSFFVLMSLTGQRLCLRFPLPVTFLSFTTECVRGMDAAVIGQGVHIYLSHVEPGTSGLEIPL